MAFAFFDFDLHQDILTVTCRLVCYFSSIVGLYTIGNYRFRVVFLPFFERLTEIYRKSGIKD